MRKQFGVTAPELLIVLMSLAGVIGWAWNIVRIVGMIADPITGLFIFRCVGIIVFPLGAILGYIPA